MLVTCETLCTGVVSCGLVDGSVRATISLSPKRKFDGRIVTYGGMNFSSPTQIGNSGGGAHGFRLRHLIAMTRAIAEHMGEPEDRATELTDGEE